MKACKRRERCTFGANYGTHRGVQKRVTHRKITLNSSDFRNDRERRSTLMYQRFTGRISSRRKAKTKKNGEGKDVYSRTD